MKTSANRLPRIADIRTTVFRLPMRGTLRWGKESSLSEVRHVLVEVTLADGSSGIAEATPRPTIYGETVYSITGIIEHELSPRLLGEPAEAAYGYLHAIKNNNTARGAIDMAIHEAVAQHCGLTLVEHLGAEQERIPVSYILGIGDEEAVLAEAQHVYDRGVRVLKVKVGRDWPTDLRHIQAIQHTLPANLQLYADANECLKSDRAMRRLAELREMGLLYCEEPLPVEEIVARAELRQANVLAIIADDSCFTLRDLRRELALDTFDILNIKTPRTGYTESRKMLDLARTAGKGVMVGSQAGSGIGAARAAIFAAMPGVEHPSELSFFLKLMEDILAEPIPIVDGAIVLDDVERAHIDRDRLRETSA